MPTLALSSPYFGNARALAAASSIATADVAERRAMVDVAIQRLPPNWGFLVIAGVPGVVEAVEHITPTAHELATAVDLGIISPSLAHRMATEPCTVDLNVPPEGSLVFAGDAIATVQGPLWQAWIVAELVQTALLSCCAITTRAARLAIAAQGTSVVDGSSCTEPSLERALRIARAAYIGGTAFTQDPRCASQLGLQVRAVAPPEFTALAELSPRLSGWSFEHSTLAVLTHLGPGHDEEDTLQELRRLGVRSGGWIARGLALDAHPVESRVDLVALEQDGMWKPKLGVTPDVTTQPGRKIVIRYFDSAQRPIADILHGVSERIQPCNEAVLVGYMGSAVPLRLEGAQQALPVLQSVVRSGKRVGADDTLSAARERCRASIEALTDTYKRLRHPAPFPVGLTPTLATLKAQLVTQV